LSLIQLDCVLSNKRILCDKELFQITLTILGEQRLVFIQMTNLGYERYKLEWCGQFSKSLGINP